MKWLSILCGIGGVGFAAFLFQNRNNEAAITNVAAVSPKRPDSATTISEDEKTNIESNLKMTSDKNSAVLGLNSTQKSDELEPSSQEKY